MKQADKTDITPLKAWMDAKGYTHSQLAQELGYGYDMIYKVATRQDRNVAVPFQIRFIKRFGWDEASKVFDVALLQADLSSEVHEILHLLNTATAPHDDSEPVRELA